MKKVQTPHSYPHILHILHFVYTLNTLANVLGLIKTYDSIFSTVSTYLDVKLIYFHQVKYSLNSYIYKYYAIEINSHEDTITFSIHKFKIS